MSSSLPNEPNSSANLPFPKPPVKSPELVKVDTALTVLSQVNLLAESNALALDIGGSLAKLIYLQPHTASQPNPPPLKIHLVDGTVATALSVHIPVLGGTLHFFAFETRNVHKLLRFIREHWAQHSNPSHRHIRATGGGSYKYAQTFRDVIDITLARLDEMKCTVAGLNFLLTSVDNEVYIYQPKLSPRTNGITSLPDLTEARRFVESNQRPFPYLLVNIGSGVSIVKVTDHDCYERISGSSLGGGTFWGLARLLLNCQTFDDVISLTNTGDNSKVDMLVGDIYGGSYPSLGLDASVIAASFGKATMRDDRSYFNPESPQNDEQQKKQKKKQPRKKQQPSTEQQTKQQELSTSPQPSTWERLRQLFVRAVYGSTSLWLSFLSSVPVIGSALRALGIFDSEAEECMKASSSTAPRMISTANGDHKFRPQDVALSLLRMVSYNIGQIAYLNARVHGLDRIYFGGNFVRDHPYTIADISFSVDFWSGGKMKALFLRHDGYLGAIGAFIGASSATPTKIIEEDKKEREEKGPKLETSSKKNETNVKTGNGDDLIHERELNGGSKPPAIKEETEENGSDHSANSSHNGTINGNVNEDQNSMQVDQDGSKRLSKKSRRRRRAAQNKLAAEEEAKNSGENSIRPKLAITRTLKEEQWVTVPTRRRGGTKPAP